MITIKELTELTNVSRKQINNRINKIRGKYPSLIKGGGKGKGGRYSVDPLFVNYLTRLNPDLPDIKRVETTTNSLVSWKNYSKISWKWFGCYSPASVYEPKHLTDLIPLQDGEIVFYSIHAKDDTDNLHIHFSSNSELPKTKLNTPDRSILLYSEVKEFNHHLKEECFDYFTNFNMVRSGRQYIVDYGFIMGYIEKKKVNRLILS